MQHGGNLDRGYTGTRPCLGPCLVMVNRTLERLDERLATPRQRKLPGAEGPSTSPRVVPTPGAATKHGTIIKYLVHQYPRAADIDKGAPREPRQQPTPPGEVLGPEGPGTPPREVATPRGNSPEMVDWRAALHGCQIDWGSASETEESPTRPMEDEQPSSSLVTEDADRYRESRAQPTPLESTPDATGLDAQPRDAPTPQGDYSAKFDWRVDLKDSTYKYDRLEGASGA